MIDRYTRPEMGHIFSLENKYAIWQEIEVLACEAHAEMGKIGITREEAAWIRKHAKFNKEEVDAIEAVTNHDVIAFLTNMGEYIDAEVPRASPKPSRWVHYGMTSSDLGDTACAISWSRPLTSLSKTFASWARSAAAAPLKSARPCALAAPTASTPSP